MASVLRHLPLDCPSQYGLFPVGIAAREAAGKVVRFRCRYLNDPASFVINDKLMWGSEILQ